MTAQCELLDTSSQALPLRKQHERTCTLRLWTGHTSCPSSSAACCWWYAPHDDRASIHHRLSQSPCSFWSLHDKHPSFTYLEIGTWWNGKASRLLLQLAGSTLPLSGAGTGLQTLSWLRSQWFCVASLPVLSMSKGQLPAKLSVEVLKIMQSYRSGNLLAAQAGTLQCLPV